MDIKLKSTPEEITKKLQGINTFEDVANLLEIPSRFLRTILYGIKERKKYRSFEIQKKNGNKRTINAPPKNISILQKKLNVVLNLIYKPKISAHGFIKGKSIVTNAEIHVDKRHVLNIDLEDFFPSIYFGRIRGMLKSAPINMGDQAAIVIAQICTMADGILPQGGSTSPTISNLICRTLDNQLTGLAKQYGCNYSRYADDITFSTNQKLFPSQIAAIEENSVTIGKYIENIIQDNKFSINKDKNRYFSKQSHQNVTGITVNEFRNIKRKYIRSISAALYAWERYGYDNANKVYTQKYLGRQGKGIHLKNVLRGRLAYIKMVRGENDYIYRKLTRCYLRLSGDKIKTKEIHEIPPSPLRGGFPKYHVWNLWFNKYKDLIIFLEINIRGDLFTGTGFYIGNGIIATAGHNLDCDSIKIYQGDTELPVNETRKWDGDRKKRNIDVGLIKTRSEHFQDWLPTQTRLPETGEEVTAIGFPVIPWRQPILIQNHGFIEGTPISHCKTRFVQLSFRSGGGLSGAPLIDRRGYVVGIVVENVYPQPKQSNDNNPQEMKAPPEIYGQAIPVEYFWDFLKENT